MIARRYDAALPEMMDRRGHDPDLLRADLDVLETINRYLGGHRIVRRHLRALAPDVREDGTYVPSSRTSPRATTVLDLATGAGDIPRALAGRYNVTGVDKNPEILRIARERSPGIRFEQHDLLDLPYAAGSFDVVLCSLALHHFAEDDVVAILRRVGEIARVGYIVNDLRRHRLAIALSKLMARTIITNPIARFDAPASCERAFTVAELDALARRAGLANYRIRRHWAFRMALVGVK